MSLKLRTGNVETIMRKCWFMLLGNTTAEKWRTTFQANHEAIKNRVKDHLKSREGAPTTQYASSEASSNAFATRRTALLKWVKEVKPIANEDRIHFAMKKLETSQIQLTTKVKLIST